MTRYLGIEGFAEHGRVYDAVIVGSGPAGSMVAAQLAAAGWTVAVVEEGDWTKPQDFPLDHAAATAKYYRDHGMSAMLGTPPTPYLQGCAVGGTSVVNGAISWRMPENVFNGWLERDPGLAATLNYEALMRATDAIEARLNIHPTEARIAGAKNSLMAIGADALGLEHRPISRNVRDCRGSGRCVQGCPHGAKQSMDITYLADAEAAGADVYSRARVTRILHSGARATGIIVRVGTSQDFELHARRAVVVAASAVGTPILLQRSAIRGGPLGQHFACHPGTSAAGRFAAPVYMWEGATQGHEVIGLRHEGLKFEALGFDISILAGRLPGLGAELMANLHHMHHDADWGVAVKATGTGRVRALGAAALVSWSPSAADVMQFRRGLVVLTRMMLAAGAESVYLGVAGWQEPVMSNAQIDRFAKHGPLDARAYQLAVTHMFGTCRMGSDPAASVVDPHFQHHRVHGLYVADSSVFPSNTGVNPQTSILAMAQMCAEQILQRAA